VFCSGSYVAVEQVHVHQCRDVRKTEFQFGFGLKNRTIQKFDIHSDGFSMETACNLPLT